MGYNVVRLISNDFIEPTWGTKIWLFTDPVTWTSPDKVMNLPMLEKWSILISALKKKGISIQIDVMSSLEINSIPALGKYNVSNGWLAGLSFLTRTIRSTPRRPREICLTNSGSLPQSSG